MSRHTIPTFSELLARQEGPHGNAWAIWGPNDQLGSLNHLTDEIVALAAREITSGERVSLNWSMSGPSNPQFGRKLMEVKLINWEPAIVAHDEEWTFNSQISSQWDGLRHYAYQKEKLYYGGHTAESFYSSDVNGIQNMARKGIAGRGVLIDWYRWATDQKNISVDAFTTQDIPFEQVLEAAAYQGINRDDFRQGDILIIRSGYIHQYQTLSDDRRKVLNETYKSQRPQSVGVLPSREVLEFLWEKRIAAVAGDARSFEQWPCKVPEWSLHQWLLAGWGMPIGELFDLEELSHMCAELGRYTFFFSSSPMNVPGGVASPPNALAFF